MPDWADTCGSRRTWTAGVKALAILTAAREAGGHYVWTVNQRGAKEANLEDDVIAAIREFRAPVGLPPNDAAVVQFVLELLRQTPYFGCHL